MDKAVLETPSERSPCSSSGRRGMEGGELQVTSQLLADTGCSGLPFPFEVLIPGQE